MTEGSHSLLVCGDFLHGRCLLLTVSLLIENCRHPIVNNTKLVLSPVSPIHRLVSTFDPLPVAKNWNRNSQLLWMSESDQGLGQARFMHPL